MPRYRVADHTADLGVFFYADSPSELLLNSGLALFALLVERPPRKGQESISLEVEGDDPIDLLVCWLSELLYLFHSRRSMVTDIRIDSFSEEFIRAGLTLAPFDPDRHRVRNDIKAVTYHRAEFGPFKKGWRGRVTFDL